MQNKLLSTLALLVATGITIPAFAEGIVSGGIQSTTMNVNSEMNTISATGGELESSESDQNVGVSGELALGYQLNFNHLYNISFELFAQLVNTEVQVPVFVGDGDAYNDNNAEATVDWLAGFRLRPGYYVTPTTRLFADVGLVWGEVEVDYSDGLQSPAFNGLDIHGGSDSDTLLGWRYGAGVEHKITHNFLVGLDYTITEFDDLDADAAADALTDAQNSASLDYTATLYTLGLNFKYLFGVKKQPARRYEMKDK